MAKRNKLSRSSLLWFIRSRSYVPVPELRRRFDLDGIDEIRVIQTADGPAYVGLPERAAQFVEALTRESRLGLNLAPDLTGRIVQGIYAHEPVRMPVGLQASARAHEPPPEDAEGDEPEEGDATERPPVVSTFRRPPPRPMRAVGQFRGASVEPAAATGAADIGPTVADPADSQEAGDLARPSRGRRRGRRRGRGGGSPGGPTAEPPPSSPES